MKPHRLGTAAALLLCLSLQAAAVEVISNNDVKSETLSLSNLRSIFSMRMSQWPDGTPIRVFVLSDKHPLHAQFTKKLLGVFPHQLRRAWNRQIYSGIGQAPGKVDTEAEMRGLIAATPGAIGYLSQDLIDEHVQTIDIE